MKREIKFRAWDGENKKMITSGFIIKNDGSIRIWDGSDWGANQYTINLGSKLMQYTGLLDKNGKEIYEGDKVKITYCDLCYLKSQEERNNNMRSHLTLVRITSAEGVVFEDIDGESISLASRGRKEGQHNDLEVIGNLYENKDLLKVGKDQ